jgi:protection of telomeres protein 1
MHMRRSSTTEAMISTQDSEENSSLELPLPPQFEKIEDIMRMPSERLRKNPLLNLIGLVKDYQPPIPTKGVGMKSNVPWPCDHFIEFIADFKCSLTIVDLSTQTESGNGAKVVIFRPKDKMPRISGVRDVVLLRKFKVQY